MLVAIGGGVGFLIKRQDTRADKRESEVVAILKDRVAALQTMLADEESKHRRIRHTAGKWRDQLHKAGIEPDPLDWPDAEEG
ncbi:MAG: hypothetical protein J7474_02940 [Arthrobacter sp.]|nr:hypothetical protein [Arthrobacter sp.]